MTPRRFMDLFDEFRARTWDGWRAVLDQLGPAVREFYAICGRGSGKSRIVALLAACFAARRYKRAPGELIYVGVFGPDRKQAAITFGYIRGLLRARSELASLIVGESKDRIELSTGVVVEVLTASAAAPRGRAYALAIVEEAAFLPVDESSAEPDIELVRALRPGLARVPGSLGAIVSSPHREQGVIYDAFRAGSSEDRLVVVADTLTLNPSFARREVERAFEQDPVAAASEYGRDGAIVFRSDVSALVTGEALAAVVPSGIRELPPAAGTLHAHFDAATGSGQDAAALAIAYAGQPAELACIRRWKPPFSPSAVIAEAAQVLAAYGLRSVSIDRFAPGLVAELFREHSVSCAVAERTTSEAFLELLALVNSQRVVLLDDSVLLGELRRLERRPSSAGRELVGHPSGAHDDLAAATAQALTLAARKPQPSPGIVFGRPLAAAAFNRRLRRPSPLVNAPDPAPASSREVIATGIPQRRADGSVRRPTWELRASDQESRTEDPRFVRAVLDKFAELNRNR